MIRQPTGGSQAPPSQAPSIDAPSVEARHPAPGTPTIALRLQIAEQLGWQCECLDPGTGWLWLLSRGEDRYVLHGSHAAINDHAAASLALDKAYTGMALALAEREGYPLVVKPNRGSRGREVNLARDRAELAAAAAAAWAIDRVALVQVPVPGFDLRIDVLDGELLLAYVRRPLIVIGDGQAELVTLHERADHRVREPNFAAKIRASPAWLDTLAARGLEPSSVLPAGERLVFETTIFNLHKCCVGELVRELPRPWVELCVRIGQLLGLRHCGVDLRVPMPIGDEDPLQGDPREATVLEVNASPAVGQISKLGGGAEALAAERRVVETMLAQRGF